MKASGQLTRTIHPLSNGHVEIIDQTLLPHRLQWRTLGTLADACEAIAVMRVRGAPLIGISNLHNFHSTCNLTRSFFRKETTIILIGKRVITGLFNNTK